MDTGWALLLLLALLQGFMLLGGYLTQGQSFPRPLSRSEERRYLEALKQGDPHARRVLIERNLRLVAHIVKKFDNTGEDTDDLISIGTIGLIKGVNTFDPDKGTRLATYAARCIENEILMHLRATRRTRYETSLHDPIGVDREGNEITLLDVLKADTDDMDELVDRKLFMQHLRQQVHRLGRRERRVIELRFGLHDGLRRTQRDVARELGISRSYVSRIEKKAVRMLSDYLSSRG
ncbi:MAG: RNA polymerase sporulation sigma factor SigK [Thermaerobacter sp.]|nr:RNA polymerase sporulation sigma factor SigK [Bacillota bacterium]REJ36332.1 MAG: RNA polymerase sporulation sigma factor SigK [Bacillota bacterium]